MLQKTKDLPKILKNAFICLFIAALLTLGAAAAEALVIEGSVFARATRTTVRCSGLTRKWIMRSMSSQVTAFAEDAGITKLQKKKTMSIHLAFSPPMKRVIFGAAPTLTAARPSITDGMNLTRTVSARSAAISMSTIRGKRASPFRRMDTGLPARKAAARQDAISRCTWR